MEPGIGTVTQIVLCRFCMGHELLLVDLIFKAGMQVLAAALRLLHFGN